MHILIIPSEHLVTESAPLAGTFQYEQAQALAAAGHQVGVISVGFITLRYLLKRYKYKGREILGDLSLLRKYKRLIFPHRYYSFAYLNKKYVALFLKEFDAYVQMHGMPDIVHAHNFLYAGFIAKELKVQFNLPFVLTEHSTSFARGLIPKAMDKHFHTVSSYASTLTCVSTPFKELLMHRLGVEFHVLHNIVDKSFFILPFIEKNKEFAFINVALLDDKKNQKLLLAAFAQEFKGQNIHLKIVGDGPLMTDLITLSEKLGVESQVEFLGRLPREEVRSQLLKAHCFVLPSNYETFGVVLIEALASGLPLIATKCGGPEDIVNQGNGLLIDTENLEQLSVAMQMMVQWYNEDGLQAFKPEALRQEALEKYGEEAFVKNALHYYKLAIEAN